MSVWTPERIAEVTRLWGEGVTTAEIGELVGVTKNAVVGKAHRLGLPPRPSPIRPKGDGRVGDRGRGATQLSATASGKIVQQVALATFGARCKWPFGHPDEANFHFCSSLALVNSSYCSVHYQMAYLPARPRKDRQESQSEQPRAITWHSGSAA